MLARSFQVQGHEVTVVQRSAGTSDRWRVLIWDGKSIGDWADTVDGADVIINLAGRTVNCRYTPEHKKEIKESRWFSTCAVGEAISKAKNPPALWLQMSTATIYAHSYDAPNDEFTGIIGGDESGAPEKWRFSIDVARTWESAVKEFDTPQTRKVLLRTAIVMSPDRGGPFDTILRLVRFGLGGQNGDGKQYISWITDLDFTRAIDYIIMNDQIAGVVNMAAPNPLTNADFMRTLRSTWGSPIGLPSMEWMIEIGALFLGSETELLLKSRRVIPGVLTAENFKFDFPDWQSASRNLCERWRQLN